MPRTRTVDPIATLAKQRATLLARQAQIRAKLADNETAQRTRDRQARVAKQGQVGKLADDAGLLGYDVDVLEKAFARLAVELAGSLSPGTERAL